MLLILFKSNLGAYMLFFSSVKKCVLFILFASIANLAYAESVSVGRASFELPPGDWKLIAVKDSSTTLDGSTARAAKTETQSFGLIQSGELIAVLAVTATSGGQGNGNVHWTTPCISGTNSYAVNLEKGFKQLNCAVATGILNSEAYLNGIIPDIKNLMTAQGVKIAPRMTSSRALSGSTSGTYMNVNLIASAKFMGISSSQVFENLPPTIKQANIAWAVELSGAVKDSVESMRGRLTLPAINWTN
jgi:hypothetical protein